MRGVFRLLPSLLPLFLLLNPRLRLLLDRRRRTRAPALFLLRLLFRRAMQRTRGVDRRMRDAADLHVGFVFLEERFPVFDALQTILSVEVCTHEREMRVGHAWSSLSESRRRSCVRWSLKQPVPKARAASMPVLLAEGSWGCSSAAAAKKRGTLLVHA